MREHRGILVVSDHRYVDDLYLGKNKFFDKASKEGRVYNRWFGDSIFYASSGQAWQEQRKHVAAAFYRDKMQLLLKATMTVANDRV